MVWEKTESDISVLISYREIYDMIAPDRLKLYFQVKKGDFEKWKSKILKTEIQSEKN